MDNNTGRKRRAPLINMDSINNNTMDMDIDISTPSPMSQNTTMQAPQQPQQSQQPQKRVTPKKPQQQSIQTQEQMLARNNTPQNIEADLSDLNSGLTDDINRSNEKKQRAKLEKQQRDAERKQKVKSKLPILIGGVAGCLVLVVIIVALNIVKSNSDYTLNLIDSGIIVPQQASFEDTSTKYLVMNNNNKTDNSSDNQTDQPIIDSKYNIVQLGTNESLKAGQTILIDTIINTKESWETEYSDHKTQFFFTYNKIETNYEKIVDAVNEFNETSNNKINIPSESEYTNANLQLVCIETTIAYPENFPTYNTDGKVWDIPTVEASIQGLCEEQLLDEELEKSLDCYILIDDMIYEISDFIALNNKIDEMNIHDEYKFRFITSLPIRATPDLYKITLNVKTSSGNTSIGIE